MTATSARRHIQANPATSVDLAGLDDVQKRVLWLAVSMIHHANKVRATPSGVKVGGHQASSASLTSIMTALYFAHLSPSDRVSVKPHAAPVLHAINYLLGRLPQEYLTELRAYKGLQSYPSRVKDPDPVDFSTGSVGIGATATLWSALAQRYVGTHFNSEPGGRHIALLGDAELDEGAIWEALVDPLVARMSNVLWIVDLNRQSLDRVVPDIAAGRIARMFDAAGWQTLTAKYGSGLRAAFAEPSGDALHERIELMNNEEYQRLLRCPPDQLREKIAGSGRLRRPILRSLRDRDDIAIAELIRDLGGHDLGDLLRAFEQADADPTRPTVLFAYTIKAWRLPTQGHPANHSALLSEAQWRELAAEVGADADDPWRRFEPDSPAGQLSARAAERLTRPAKPAVTPVAVPLETSRTHSGKLSTQQAFGRVFTDLAHEAPHVAERIVTVSPDVASSTNLGGWINRVGIWNVADRVDWFADDTETLVRWKESTRGQHIELGIAEGNLVGLLGELGATWSRDGHQLIPIGTIYDPFVTRALEPWSFGIYAGGQSILVGTPSGVTLAPEGGAHQSIVTPSVGIEQPQCVAWEPAFGKDLEWCLLHAISRVGHPGGSSAYLRLSTRPIPQALAALPTDDARLAARRADVVAGGYVIRRAAGAPRVTLAATGVVMPEVLAAADELAAAGLEVDVVCVTSADLLFRACRARAGFGAADDAILDRLFPPDRSAPLVTVLDGHPHTLAFLAGINGTPVSTLGVDDFGQVGDVSDLYRHFGIDTDTIVGAAWDLID